MFKKGGLCVTIPVFVSIFLSDQNTMYRQLWALKALRAARRRSELPLPLPLLFRYSSPFSPFPFSLSQELKH